MIELVIILLFVIAISFYISKASSKGFPLDIPNLKGRRVIYCDSGYASIFRNKKHRIVSKPDFIVVDDKNRKIVVEYKGRKRGIYSSDINQLKATIVAVRDKHPGVVTGYVINDSGQYKKVDAYKSTELLVSEMKTQINNVRLIKSGVCIEYTPVTKKCKGCGFNESCDVAAA